MPEEKSGVVFFAGIVKDQHAAFTSAGSETDRCVSRFCRRRRAWSPATACAPLWPLPLLMVIGDHGLRAIELPGRGDLVHDLRALGAAIAAVAVAALLRSRCRTSEL